MSEKIKVGDRLERAAARNRQCQHDSGESCAVVAITISGWKLDSGYIVHRDDVARGLWRRLPREDAKPALPEIGRRVRLHSKESGRVWEGLVSAGTHAGWIHVGDNPETGHFDAPCMRQFIERWEYIADPPVTAEASSERGNAPTSGRLLGASPIPRPEPPVTRGSAERLAVDACHQKCTVGAPCRRAKCANAVNADSEERRINAMAPPQWPRCPHGNAQGYCKRCGHELPRPRPYSLGSDPLAAMLRAPGACVMRGRRW